MTRIAFLLAAAAALSACAGDRDTIGAMDRPIVWCYRTLADPECYLRPEGDRQTGYIGAFAYHSDAFWVR